MIFLFILVVCCYSVRFLIEPVTVAGIYGSPHFVRTSNITVGAGGTAEQPHRSCLRSVKKKIESRAGNLEQKKNHVAFPQRQGITKSIKETGGTRAVV